MSRFAPLKVNDEVVVHGLKHSVQWNGSKGIIMQSATHRPIFIDGPVYRDDAYLVYFEQFGAVAVPIDCLRKPPEEFDHATKLECAELIARLTRVHAFEKAAKP